MKDVDVDEIYWLGAALIASQRVEFALTGLSTVLKDELKADARIRKIDVSKLFSNDTHSIKVTLGQLSKAIGDVLLLNSTDFLSFIEDRNFIIHHYWRIQHSDIEGIEKIYLNPTEFLRNFTERGALFCRILLGLGVLMKQHIHKENGLHYFPSDVEQQQVAAYHKNVEDVVRLRKPE